MYVVGVTQSVAGADAAGGDIGLLTYHWPDAAFVGSASRAQSYRLDPVVETR